jgi:hypothetical protein
MDDPQMPLNSAVGLVVVNWSLLEHSIDLVISLIFNEFGGDAFIKEVPKTRLNQKLSFLSTSFKKLPKLDEYKSQGMIFIDDIKKFSIDRHRIIHGVVIHATPDFFLYTKTNYDDVNELDLYKYTLTDLLDYGKKMQGLATNFDNFARRIINAFAIEKIQI